MPEMGESVTEGIVLEWHVAEGDFVNEGDTVVEVSTDKVDAEVPAPTDGVITKLVAAVDDEVPVGAPLAEMEAGEGSAPRVPALGCGGGQAGGACGRGRGFVLGTSTWPPRVPAPGTARAGLAGNGAPTCARRRWRAGLLRRPGSILLRQRFGTGRQGDQGGRAGRRERRRRRRGCRDCRRGEAVAGAGGDAGQGDGREPGGADGDLVPDDRGGHAGREAQGDQRRC